MTPPIRCSQCLATLPRIGACQAEPLIGARGRHKGRCWGGTIPAELPPRDVKSDRAPLPLRERPEPARQLSLLTPTMVAEINRWR